MKYLEINILVIFICLILDNVSTENPHLTRSNYDCQLDYFKIPGVCKRFSECPSAQTEYYAARIYPTFCHYIKFDPIVCCSDKISIPHRKQLPFVDNTGLIIAGEIRGNKNDNIDQLNQSMVRKTIVDLGRPNRRNKQKPIPTKNNEFSYSDCTVVFIEDEKHPFGTPCVVPDPRKLNENKQNVQKQFRPIMDSKLKVLLNDQPNTPTLLKEQELKKSLLRQDNSSPEYSNALYAYLSLFGK